jgi:lysine 6-dehydrogenase
MGYRYLILGSGRQGVAAGYDLARFGGAEELRMADLDLEAARTSSRHINELIESEVARPIRADAGRVEALVDLFSDVDTVVSGVHFPLNPGITDAAIRAGANLCDMGGNTDVVREQLERDGDAKRAGVTVVPDCGMGPGMNVSLAVYAMSLLDDPREVRIYVGGLPEHPKPPWNYDLIFNVEGLTNEYSGRAYVLRDGNLTEVPCLSERETLDFPPPIGRLEASFTSGGLSTAPWTFLGTLDILEYKTLRYPGHWERIQALADLGLLDLEPLEVGGTEIIPRDVLNALLKRTLARPEVRDVGVMRVKCTGKKDGRQAEALVDLVDRFDDRTGFTAMQRLTGWHTSIMAILATTGRIERGAVPVEQAAPGQLIVEEARKRGFAIEERTQTGSDLQNSK